MSVAYSPAPSSSPACSEISVGAPSPPPAPQLDRQPNAGRVKSFAIDDILAPNVPHANDSRRTTVPDVRRPPWNPMVVEPFAMRAYLPAALLRYDHQMALQYQQKLQEHFKAQALMLSQMSMKILPFESCSERSSSADSDELANDRKKAKVPSGDQKRKPNGNPLDAMLKMSTKDYSDPKDQSHVDLFANRQPPKKKRKSRTAFTNHQIFELEKRFLYQKYLSPADRDEIASGLGLSNAQVITWFQNRRAKLKRDIEELKKDVESVQTLSKEKSFLEHFNDFNILKKKCIDYDEDELKWQDGGDRGRLQN